MRADSVIAEAALVSAYPLLTRRREMVEATAVTAPEPQTMRAPVNALVHGRATPDTLRCSAWLDLSGGPIVLSVPDTWGRYYALWLRDAWGTVFASIGARTTGTRRRDFVVVGPGRRAADVPAGLTPILAPTRTVHISGRIEAVGENDAEAIAHAHDSFRLSGTSALAPALAALDDEGMDDGELVTAVLALAADEHTHSAALDRLREVGVRGDGVERGIRRGRAALRTSAQTTPARGWTRAANEPAADVLHLRTDRDAADEPLSGDRRYLLRFPPDAAPPVNGFWELTAGVRSVGDRHPLALDVDGALDVHIQHAPPARSRRWNWLPAPAGPFSLALHLYWPRPGTWSPPLLERCE